ncbi:MAG: GHKL domain-containing protein [Ruminococcaceae bacterium]|nr:GHKL domain-containing protein [Oscillospiraceae bacterium]
MYNMSYCYEILSAVMLVVRCAASSALCLSYTRSFLKEKNNRRSTSAVWHIIYILGALALYYAFNTVNVFQNIICTVLKIVFLMILQRLLFHNGGAINWFTVFSFLVGRTLTLSIISVLVYRIMGDTHIDILYGIAEIAEMDSEQFLIEYGHIVLFVLNAVTSVIAAVGFILMLKLYLSIIKKSFRKKDHRLQRKESVFLIFPLAASLCISITVRMMEFTEKPEIYSDIFDVVPVTIFFIPFVDFLLLGTNIASVILFQSLVEYNEEKNKRDLLESQISRMESEIKEMQDIYSDIRGLRHDMKNHITDISMYVKKVLGKDDPIVEDYIGKMTETVDRLDFSFNTGNPITDIIVHQKGMEAEKRGISFMSDFSFPVKGNIDVYDMGIILNNALENAVEACEGLMEPYIFLRSYTKGNLFFIESENNFSGEIELGGETGLPLTSKKNPDSHGLGLSNIRRTAEKYMGDIDISTVKKDGERIFTLTVMLNTDSALKK